MLVGAARTREPRPSAPVMTARAAVGLRFRPVRLGCIAICPSPTTYTNRDAHPLPSLCQERRTGQRCITGTLLPAKLRIFSSEITARWPKNGGK